MSALPLQIDQTIRRGESFRREYRWKPDGTNPQDFTGWLGRVRIGDANVAVIELTSPDAGVSLTTTGQIIMTMTPEQTAALPWGDADYQLDLIDPDDGVTRFLCGRARIIADVGPPVS